MTQLIIIGQPFLDTCNGCGATVAPAMVELFPEGGGVTVRADWECPSCELAWSYSDALDWVSPEASDKAWREMVQLGQEIGDEPIPHPAASTARHNHVTRDIKPEGQCPGCDRYHASRRTAGEG